jgi:D-alanyl-D-alanine carboxypeptidase
MNWTDRLAAHRRGRVPQGQPPGRARRWLLGPGTAIVAGAMIAAAAPAAASTVAAKPTPVPGFRAALEQIVNDGVPGAIGLARRGGRVVAAASGAADLATGRPMAVADRVRAGSITKTLVATVVLQLAVEHRLHPSDSIARWLPGVVPGGQAITLRELLQHTSGIYDYTNDPGFLKAVQADPARVWPPRALIAIAVAHPPLFPPGTAFRYSNTDYLLLGLIIQKTTGHPLGQELAARIFTPLSMRHTTLPVAQVTPPVPYAHGYLLHQPGAPGPLDVTRASPSIGWAAGGVVSTAGDLARFYTALLFGQLLPPPLLRQMLTTIPIPTVPGGRYGLGILSVHTPCGIAWGHNGDFPGYYSNAFTTRGGGRQAIVLVNADYSTLTAQQFADVGAAVLAGLCGHP